MFEFLFLDLDDTILDFGAAERVAISQTLPQFGISPTEEVLKRYKDINRACWEALERKEMTREQILVGRFVQLFGELGVAADPQTCAREYERNLSIGHYFLPGAKEAVERLSKKYKLYITTNGTARVQEGKLASANISEHFQNIFISQLLGADKPDVEFFNRCFAQIPGFDKSRAMIVGDSLSSDILGGIAAGITTCWVNPAHKPAKPGIQPDYQIETIAQLEELLEKCQ